MNTLCDFGCGREATITFKNGKHCCEKSVNQCPAKRSADSEAKKGKVTGKIKETADQQCPYCGIKFKKLARHLPHCHENPNYVAGENQYTSALRQGKAKPSLSIEARLRLSAAVKSRSREWNTANGRKISAAIQKKIAANEWHMQFRNQRIFRYKGVVLQSTWEYLYARFLDINQIEWQRPREGFEYAYEGRVHKYFPDFYLPEKDLYVEIKGRIIERDEAKWIAFPKQLQVLQQEDLLQLGVPILCSERQLLEY